MKRTDSRETGCHDDLTLRINTHPLPILGTCPTCERTAPEFYTLVCSEPSCGYREVCCSLCASTNALAVLRLIWAMEQAERPTPLPA